MTTQILIDDNLITSEFLKQVNVIFIPKKLHKVVNFIPESYLVQIHKDIEIAKELCLYFISFIIETVFEDGLYYDGKRLLSSNLAKFLASAKSKTQDNNTYQNIINALVNGTDNGPILIVDIGYIPGEYSRKYNLTDLYKCGVQQYELKTKYVKDIKYKNHIHSLIKANSNAIAINELKLYSFLDLPTKQELLIKAKELIKNKYTTKKGKILTMRNRKDKSYWKDAANRSFVENDIELYEYYVLNGFMIPVIGEQHCPRVYDSLSLLPSWIRNEIKFNGEQMYEVDYKCLHPNLIMSIYNGSTKFITHEKISEKLNKDVRDIKIKHLSFFNLEENHFKSSKLYNYYNEIEPQVTWEILEDKKVNGYKVTSKLLTTLEVELMTNVIKKLNDLDIYVVYIYDAIMTTKENIDIALKIMNETALELNIYTIAETKYKQELIKI